MKRLTIAVLGLASLGAAARTPASRAAIQSSNPSLVSPLATSYFQSSRSASLSAHFGHRPSEPSPTVPYVFEPGKSPHSGQISASSLDTQTHAMT